MGKTVVVFAPGESLTLRQTEAVRGIYQAVAVCDAYRLAPWSDALVANDAAWWENRPKALKFAGRKFSANDVSGVEKIPPFEHVVFRGSSSGVIGVLQAWRMGAARILLVGFDNRGTHFFGAHDAPLKNTTSGRYAVFATQFETLKMFLANKGVQIMNCTPGSALNCFDRANLEDCLPQAIAA